MEENYLAKWLNGELSPEELERFKASPEYATYARIAAASEQLDGPDFDVDQAYEELRQKRQAKAVKVVRMNPWTRVVQAAAVVVLFVGLSFWFLNTRGERVTTGYAESTSFNLPDNSEVVLNAGTKIKYNEKKWDQDRSLTLEGEAFFKVAKGKAFTVNTDIGEVTVLGTEFNVAQRDAYFEVSCYEGKVRVSYGNQAYELPAGNSFQAIGGKIIPVPGPEGNRPSWMTQESSFRSVPLSYVFAELERQFDIRIDTRNVDPNQIFTGSFSNTDLDLALQSISTPSQLKYRIEGENVLIYAEENP